MNSVQEYIENFPVAEYDGLASIGYGEKYKSGSSTKVPAVIFCVSQKKGLKDIPTGQLLPSTINAGGVKVLTDVIEENISWEFEGYCHADQSTTPVSDHKMKTRPLMGGISIGNYDHQIRSNVKLVGTLGAIVVDATDQQLVGLSNNHVLTPEVFSTANEQSTSYNYKDERIIQPAGETGSSPSDNIVGTVKRVYPIKGAGKINNIDAGIFNITSIDGVLDTTSTQQLNFTESTDPGVRVPIQSIPFATTAEIDTLVNQDYPVFKASRTTGPVGHPAHETSCELRIEKLHFGPALVSGMKFQKLIQYKGIGFDPSGAGDSGGLLCCQFGDPLKWKVIGLHMAGGMTTIDNVKVDFGLACRIDEIAELLKIKAYVPVDGVSYTYGQTSPIYKVVAGFRSDPSIIIDGKTYWQVGRTDEPTNT